jgi:hypothetical protein
MKKIFTLLLTFLGMTYANAQCNHTFRMADSYGDGWNGSTVDVTVNGTAVLTAQEPVSGDPAEDVSFSASTGDAIALANWATGSWTGEVSWEILDGAGAVIASGVHGDVAGGAGNCPSCLPPNSLATANLTQSSVDFSWTAGASETAWNVEYGAAGFASGSGTVVAVTATNYSVTGLTANTSYDMYVQADCGAAQSAFVGPISITTPCAAAASPFDEGFENAGATPSCWALGGGEDWLFNTSGPNHVGNGGTITGSTTTGNYYAVVDASGYSGTNGSATLTTPPVDVSTLTAAELTFFLISDDEGFGFSSTLTVTANGDTVGSFTGNTSGWEEKIVDLSAYTGTVTVQFAFSEDPATGAYYDDIAIDDVSIHEAPSCPAPTALATANITDVSADLSWTAGGTETAWNIEYGAAGFAPGSGTTVAVTATSYSFTGLTASTSYDMYVQSDCGGSLSAFTGPISATTLPTAGSCGYFTAELIDTYGDGWNGNGLEVSINGTVTDTLTIVIGAGPETTLISVNISDIVDFNYIVDAYATGANTYPGENVFNIYDHAGIVIAAEAGSATGPPGSALGLTACPSCTAPNTLTASNITTSSADLGWVAGGTETAWNIEYGVTGFAQGTGTIVAATTNPYSLTGLTAATAYDYYIQSDCGGGDTSVYVGPYTFGTACSADVAPYLENFDSGLSVCWTNPGVPQFGWTLNSGGTTSSATGPSDDITGGGNYMYIETSTPRAPGDSAFLVSSVIDISSLAAPELRFFSHMYGASMGELSIHIVASTNPALTMIWQKLGDQGNQWNEETVDLSAYIGAQVQFIILGVVGDDGSGVQYWSDAAVDNFQVRELPGDDLSCIGLSSSAVTGCDLTASETVTITVYNNAQNAQSNIPVSYGVNGSTPTVETIAGPLNGGDTISYTFTQTADMSADGMYQIAAAVNLATDQDTTNNAASMVVENQVAGTAPTTMGDSICNGDTAMVSASSTGAITWYDAMTGGNMLGTGSSLSVSPSATTSYYAEAMSGNSYFENFDSYSNGDLIAQVSNDWGTWSSAAGGGADDAAVSNMQAVSAPNSLNISNANGDDIVFPFGGLFATGTFKVEFDMYYTSSAYFNLQADTVIGNAWAFSCFFDTAGFTVESATGPNPIGSWFHFELVGDLNAGAWEVLIDGVTAGTFNNANPVASVNFYGNTGNDYYIDNVSYSSPAVACPGPRAEASVVVNDCSNINENGYNEFSVYPNPNSGSFFIENLGNSTAATVSITDVQGKEVYTTSFNTNNRINVDMNNLEKGMYMVTVKSENGVQIENVIVQ